MGNSLEELYEDIQGALNTHIYSILVDGEILNKPSNPKEIKIGENSFVAIISTNVDLNKENQSVKKTLTIPYWVNKRAEDMGVNFSKTLQEALINKFVIAE